MRSLGNCAEAAKSLSAAVSMGINDKDVFTQLGTCQYKTKQYADAITSLNQAITAGDNSKEVFLYKVNPNLLRKITTTP